MQYIEPVGAQGPMNAFGHDYVDKNAGLGVAGSFLAADMPEHVQIEILNAILGSGFTPSPALDQLFRALRRQGGNWLTIGGSATALTLVPSKPISGAGETAGMPIRGAMPFAAAGPTTLLYDPGLPALPVLWADGTPIAPNDWAAGEVVSLVGTGWSFVITGISPRWLYQATTPSRRQSFAVSGTFVVPSRVTEIEAEVWGGGSGAWAAWGATNMGGGGGGGGGYARGIITGLTPGQTIAITVGAGGGAAIPGGTPTAGGTSSVGAYISATGGSINPTSSPANPVNGNFGGTGIGGFLQISGSAGQNASQGPTSSVSIGGAGGGAALGGGAQQSSFAGPGNGGVSPGGGASGGTSIGGTGYSSGAGAPGRVEISW